MVKSSKHLPITADGAIDVAAWINALHLPQSNQTLIETACHLARLTGEDQLTDYGLSCFEQGLKTAEILSELQFDEATLAAAIVNTTVKHTDLTVDDIAEQLNDEVALLIKETDYLDIIHKINQDTKNLQQIDNIRKMLLSMVRDVRAVVIKLAEQLVVIQLLSHCDTKTQKMIAKETMEIFAPLANQLGLHQVKWKLEDFAFYYLNTQEYLSIAKSLRERKDERDKRLSYMIQQLRMALANMNIKADVHGRSKHIYSIKRKMMRKNVDFSQIYDASAIRILVDDIESCYIALSLVHELWEPIQKEFDDYIANPKPNGYQSIHTAVYDEDQKIFEIQIRTIEMHEVSEKGVAAHWMYKEDKSQPSAYEEKINWLRNLLEWQKALLKDKTLPNRLEKNVFEDRVYTFTPNGDIVDLPTGATPLDFAYHIHTQVGHRCRGAKINHKIVPLTYQLKTGDHIEILTAKTPNPSRDWLTPKRNYLKTSGARAKVLQWFKRQDYDVHVVEGKATLDRELSRLNIDNVNFTQAAIKLNYKSSEGMFAALGNGSLKLSRIMHVIYMMIEPLTLEKVETPTIISTLKKSKGKNNQVTISGVENLLSKLAKCCKPLPGDPIIGYITQGLGITIHRQDCKNIENISHQDRFIDVAWQHTTQKFYPVEVEVIAYDRSGLIQDITGILANEKINITDLKTRLNKKRAEARMVLTLEISDLESLGKVLDHINQLPNVHTVRRCITSS